MQNEIHTQLPLESWAVPSAGKAEAAQSKKPRSETVSLAAGQRITDLPEYECWSGMKQRCLNERDDSFAGYGGRGITVCERWMSFVNFFSDMGPRPSINHSIERKDNNIGYDPGNCKWATRQEQMNNRRGNIRITFGGKTQTCSQWAREMGIRKNTLNMRLKAGWSAADALTLPVFEPPAADELVARKVKGEAMRKARLGAGLTLKELWRRLNQSKNYLSDLELGLKKWTPEKVRQWEVAISKDV